MTQNVQGANSPAWNTYTDDSNDGYMELLFPGQTPTNGAFWIDQNTDISMQGNLTVTGNADIAGVLSLTGGTAPTPTVIASPGFMVGAASQLSDKTRDYMVYLTIGTAGTGCTLTIGPTGTPAYTIHSSSTPTAAMQLDVRLPAGWYLELAGSSTTIANQIAIGC